MDGQRKEKQLSNVDAISAGSGREKGGNDSASAAAERKDGCKGSQASSSRGTSGGGLDLADVTYLLDLDGEGGLCFHQIYNGLK